MKKRVFTAILLIGILLVAGCGSRNQQEIDEYEQRYSQAGAIVDAGNVKAVCPGGWTPVDAYDLAASTKDKSKNVLEFVKGGTSINDNKPFIRIQANNPEEEQVFPNKSLYQDVSDLATFMTGTHIWNGFTGLMNGQRFAWLQSGANGESIEVWLFMHTGEEVQAFVTDSDVFMILESIEAAENQK